MHMRHNFHNHRQGFFSTGLFALGLGTLIGYLFAPKTGRETRDDIANWMSNMSDEIQSKVSRVRNLVLSATMQLLIALLTNTKKCKASNKVS